MEESLTLHQTVREAIAQALVHLMRQKSFDEITVSEIVAKAGVSRSSFYRNYQDKEAVLLDYIARLYDQSFANENIRPLPP